MIALSGPSDALADLVSSCAASGSDSDSEPSGKFKLEPSNLQLNLNVHWQVPSGGGLPVGARAVSGHGLSATPSRTAPCTPALPRPLLYDPLPAHLASRRSQPGPVGISCSLASLSPGLGHGGHPPTGHWQSESESESSRNPGFKLLPMQSGSGLESDSDPSDCPSTGRGLPTAPLPVPVRKARAHLVCRLPMGRDVAAPVPVPAGTAPRPRPMWPLPSDIGFEDLATLAPELFALDCTLSTA